MKDIGDVVKFKQRLIHYSTLDGTNQEIIQEFFIWEEITGIEQHGDDLFYATKTGKKLHHSKIVE